MVDSLLSTCKVTKVQDLEISLVLLGRGIELVPSSLYRKDRNQCNFVTFQVEIGKSTMIHGDLEVTLGLNLHNFM